MLNYILKSTFYKYSVRFGIFSTYTKQHVSIRITCLILYVFCLLSFTIQMISVDSGNTKTLKRWNVLNNIEVGKDFQRLQYLMVSVCTRTCLSLFASRQFLIMLFFLRLITRFSSFAVDNKNILSFVFTKKVDSRRSVSSGVLCRYGAICCE